jgi:hypothetical protein
MTGDSIEIFYADESAGEVVGRKLGQVLVGGPRLTTEGAVRNQPCRLSRCCGPVVMA